MAPLSGYYMVEYAYGCGRIYLWMLLVYSHRMPQARNFKNVSVADRAGNKKIGTSGSRIYHNKNFIQTYSVVLTVYV